MASQYQLILESWNNLGQIMDAVARYSILMEKRFNLTGTQLWALWELSRGAPLALKELALRMHLDPRPIARVVEQLIAQGLVIRSRDSRDPGLAHLIPTPKAKPILAAAPQPPQNHLMCGLEAMERRIVKPFHHAIQTLTTLVGAYTVEPPFLED